MDLLTVSPDPRSLWLYRMSGQLVWKFTLKDGKSRILNLAWKPDGKILAVSCSDGLLRLCDVNNGRIIHEIAINNSGSCVGWFAEDSKACQLRNLGPFDNILKIDITSSLPKLSVLPNTSTPESIFTSKTVLDSMINSNLFSEEALAIDMLVNGCSDSCLAFNIFGHFEISNIPFPEKLSRMQPLCHTTNDDMSFHAFLVDSEDHGLYLVPMRLHFIRRFGSDLAMISSISFRIQSLLLYISDVISTIEADWKAMNDALKRFMKSADESFAGDDDLGPIQLKLLETAIMGVPDASFKKWVNDYLSDRGIRAWRKIAVTGYEAIRKLILEHLIPACERAMVLVTHLRGLARWRERGVHLGLNPEMFTSIIDIFGKLIGIGHDLLWDLNKEYEHFRAFIHWIKYVLDEAINDEGAADDPQNPIETVKVATYVTQYLSQPTMRQYCEQINGDKHLSTIVGGLKESCAMAFRTAADAMKVHVVFGAPMLVASNVKANELQIGARILQSDNSIVLCAIVAKSEKSDKILVMATQISANPAVIMSQLTKVVLLSMNSYKMGQLSFIDDEKIMFLLHPTSAEGTHRVASLELQKLLAYGQEIDTSVSSDEIWARAKNTMEPVWSQCREFGESFEPVAMAVNGRKGRRVGCVLADDGQRFLVFDLDDDEEGEDEEDEEEDSMMEV
ncbi:anaphase-promoting complex, cyclosome, subunit 4-domain-containing protein [Lipomyces arxii]|uniref:anaphase-promoting complex, cyclosome, subunit 4-domain-containing protein n=1 Tax=Lipomyces arxii TaxID=56418 RepID=UPI0034CF5F22